MKTTKWICDSCGIECVNNTRVGLPCLHCNGTIITVIEKWFSVSDVEQLQKDIYLINLKIYEDVTKENGVGSKESKMTFRIISLIDKQQNNVFNNFKGK